MQIAEDGNNKEVEKSSDSELASLNGEVPKLLQLFPLKPRSQGSTPDLNEAIPDLNITPMVEGCRSNETDMQIYVRRSPRLQKVYDGDRVTQVERASRRVSAATPNLMTDSQSTAEDCRKSRSRTKKIGDIIQLPLKAKPKATSKKMLKELADPCDMKARDTIREAVVLEKAAAGGQPPMNA